MSTQEKPADPAPLTFPDCPNWGQGGRFVLDGSGNRVPVDEVSSPLPEIGADPNVIRVAEGTSEPMQEAVTSKSKKGVNNA